ncbi:MAG TPA: ATP-dependent helicase C-terminal domain-containing protein, partial [Verrucomicrobiae bacterium]|nr:ATP-dependent helicase C-terminal domain-containing protein [Verrucomicrobiae bacterium]
FLPGVREIERTAENLRSTVNDPSVDIRPLYGAMSAADQDAAISPAPQGRRKVVLATSIAETSLTIDGVRIVVDAGLARRPRFEPALGLSRLETVRASQAAITQRAGRAGRLEPGVCWRLWGEGETRALPEFDRPEMLDADLSGLALDLAAWGVSDPTTLAWLDPPPKPAWSEALALLKRIGALDESGRLTEHGGAVARLPLPPRLAHMVIDASRQGEGLLAARIAMLLTEQGLGGRSADLRERLHRFGAERGQRADAARSLADRIARNAGGARSDVHEERAGAVLALAYPDRVAKSRGSAFTMVNGRAAAIEPASPLAREQFLVIADISGAAGRAQILLGAPIALTDIEMMFAREIETGASATIDAATGAVRDEGLALLDWDDAALQMRARVAFMHGLDAETWPDWSDEALIASLDDWLAPALIVRSRLKDVSVAEALANALPYELRRKLDAEAPARFETPAGSSLRIDYAADGGPALDVRLQELFGQDKHPSVANGRAPLSLRLLSPAHRPVQTTKDLPGFWRGSYAAVRSEMRGRYPKHPWPEDPLTAPPTRRAKPRGS